MTLRTIDAHAPALSVQEAAMLPAMNTRGTPQNLLISHNHLHFQHIEKSTPAAQPAFRRGSAAGRAILRYPGIVLPSSTRAY